ncbi:MAG TPA: cupin domain-containing protein [Desulfuromonadales bacterium]|nr:cupin domain-containing protein [Desulfuromonadales bacterium]
MNLFADLDAGLTEEEVLPLFASGSVRIERIVSTGQASAPGFWYDQPEHEWVAVLRGRGVLEYENGDRIVLAPGDHLHIPPRTRHRVRETSAAEPTVWLAFFWEDRTG